MNACLRSVAFAGLALAGCAGHAHRAHLTAHSDLRSLDTVVTSGIRNGSSGAPLQGITVSGTLVDNDASTLRCGPTAFVMTTGNNAVLPAKSWCSAPTLAPGQSATFTLTFTTPPNGNLALQFTHPDGSYERQDLTVSP